MTKLEGWIRSFTENCNKIKQRAEAGCKESKELLDNIEKLKRTEKFDIAFWAEMAHKQVIIYAMKDFAQAIRDAGEAFKNGDSDTAEAALSRMMNANPEELSAFSDIVEENTGKPSVVRDIIPLIASNKSDKLEENEMEKSINFHVNEPGVWQRL